MKVPITGSSVIVLLLFLINAQAQQSPEIPATVAQFWKRIQRARTLTYTVKEWQQDDRPFEVISGKSVFYVTNTDDVKVQRPNHVSIVKTPAIEEYEITA